MHAGTSLWLKMSCSCCSETAAPGHTPNATVAAQAAAHRWREPIGRLSKAQNMLPLCNNVPVPTCKIVCTRLPTSELLHRRQALDPANCMARWPGAFLHGSDLDGGPAASPPRSSLRQAPQVLGTCTRSELPPPQPLAGAELRGTRRTKSSAALQEYWSCSSSFSANATLLGEWRPGRQGEPSRAAVGPVGSLRSGAGPAALGACEFVGQRLPAWVARRDRELPGRVPWRSAVGVVASWPKQGAPAHLGLLPELFLEQAYRDAERLRGCCAASREGKDQRRTALVGRASFAPPSRPRAWTLCPLKPSKRPEGTTTRAWGPRAQLPNLQSPLIPGTRREWCGPPSGFPYGPVPQPALVFPGGENRADRPPLDRAERSRERRCSICPKKVSLSRLQSPGASGRVNLTAARAAAVASMRGGQTGRGEAGAVRSLSVWRPDRT